MPYDIYYSLLQTTTTTTTGVMYIQLPMCITLYTEDIQHRYLEDIHTYISTDSDIYRLVYKLYVE